MQFPKRLIEVDLPIRRISKHARREKSIRHGHISTLHIWWARRPLAACRAILCAALWPDPVDPLCPPSFLKLASGIIYRFAEKASKNKDLAENCSEEAWSRWVNLVKNKQGFNLESADGRLHLRSALIDFIADFANWDNSTVEEYLETSRALTESAHKALGGTSSTRPLIIDPFAGGGSIPLEALRVGADVFASDLNPVATLLNKVIIEYIPKYGQSLADEVHKCYEKVRYEAEKELADFYPKDLDGATPIAYLWARSIQCEGPGCGAEIPLIRSLWLAKKSNRLLALRLVPNQRVKRVDLQLIVKQREHWVNQDAPNEIITNPKFDGTVKRGSATCPCCGYTTPVSRVREQLRSRSGGAQDARLLCIISLQANSQGRKYRLPSDRDIQVNTAASQELRRRETEHKGMLALTPDEPIPLMSGVFNVPIYGHTNWKSLFTPRQALALTTIQRYINNLDVSHCDAGLQIAIKSCLAIILDKLADKATSLCGWKNTAEYMGGHTFGRQALPMFWDFCEANIFGGVSGDFGSEANWVLEFLQHGIDSKLYPGTVNRTSATDHPLPDDSSHFFFTDPPYYNAVPYADLSDFFYVWLRRCLLSEHPELFTQSETPKADECCEMSGWDPFRYAHKDGSWFETQMKRAMNEGRRVLAPSGIGCVVFAHKSTVGWESQLQAMIEAGWVVTGSWPIDTEMETRLRAMNSAVLGSSIHLVCRPRENPDGSIRTDLIGDWRDVLAELPCRIHDWMPRLADEGIVGADAIFACLGPALEIFSRYSRVEKANGDTVALKEYLEQIWAAVAREALSMIFAGAEGSGLEEDARLTAMWLWTLSTGGDKNIGAEDEDDPQDAEEGESTVKVKSSGGFALEFDAARKIAQGLGVYMDQLKQVVEINGDVARLLPVSERAGYLFGQETIRSKQKLKNKQSQLSLFELQDKDTAEIAQSVPPVPNLGETVLDRVHQSMLLFAGGRSEALKRFLVEDGVGRDARYWKLAQALSALYPIGSDEKRWVDGVLARKKGLGF